MKGEVQELLKAGTAVFYFTGSSNMKIFWTKYKEQTRKFMCKHCVLVFHNILEYKARGLSGSAPIVTSQSLDQ